LRARVLMSLPLDDETYKELGKVIHTLARLGATEIEYADAEGIVLKFPDNLLFPVTESMIRDEIRRLNITKLEIDLG